MTGMLRRLIGQTRRTLRRVGFDVVRYRPDSEIKSEIDRLALAFGALLDLRTLDNSKHAECVDFLTLCSRNLWRSNAQLFQDLFVLYKCDQKRDGYFVEFGAADGVHLSNTCLLERDYGWTGIVAEPARSWHEALKVNRNCAVDLRCVWSKSSEQVEFNEAKSAELSTISVFSNEDTHASNRANGRYYAVETVSLNDLLAQHSAPKTIDYLSIDTEGSEFEILNHFDFDRYDIRIITVENAFNEARRELIFKLLNANNYRRTFEYLSYFDDWYVKTGRS